MSMHMCLSVSLNVDKQISSVSIQLSVTNWFVIGVVIEIIIKDRKFLSFQPEEWWGFSLLSSFKWSHADSSKWNFTMSSMKFLIAFKKLSDKQYPMTCFFWWHQFYLLQTASIFELSSLSNLLLPHIGLKKSLGTKFSCIHNDFRAKFGILDLWLSVNNVKEKPRK